jgi:hypothetical protein
VNCNNNNNTTTNTQSSSSRRLHYQLRRSLQQQQQKNEDEDNESSSSSNNNGRGVIALDSNPVDESMIDSCKLFFFPFISTLFVRTLLTFFFFISTS